MLQFGTVKAKNGMTVTIPHTPWPDMTKETAQFEKGESEEGYSIPCAGRKLGLSRNGSYEAARRGFLPVVQVGGKKIVPKRAFHRMLDVEPKRSAKPISE